MWSPKTGTAIYTDNYACKKEQKPYGQRKR